MLKGVTTSSVPSSCAVLARSQKRTSRNSPTEFKGPAKESATILGGNESRVVRASQNDYLRDFTCFHLIFLPAVIADLRMNLGRFENSPKKIARQMEVISFVPTTNCAIIIQSFPKIVLRVDQEPECGQSKCTKKHLPKKHLPRGYLRYGKKCEL